MNPWQRRLFDLVASRVGLSDERLITSSNVAIFVRERMRELGLASELEVVQHVAGVELEWHAFLTALLNGQTCFFRDREQLDAAALFLKARQREVGRRVYAWSAGCSTGEEPYSLIILAEQHGVDLEVWGTDLNIASLAAARRASYGRWSLRHMQEDVSFAFVEEEDGCRVDPRLASKARFARHSLLRDPAFRSPLEGGRWDLILCRNVLIYYAADASAAVARRLAEALAPGGALGLGASESVAGLSAGVAPEQLFGRVFYRGPSDKAVKPPTEARRPLPREAPPVVVATRLEAPKGFLAIEGRVTELAESGAAADAARLLEELLAADVSDVMAMLALGHVHLRQHAFNRALEMYARVQAHDPLLPDAHLFEGVTQRKRGGYAEARHALQRALFLDPTCWPASYLLTGTLERLGKHDDAARESRRSLELLEAHGARAMSTSSLTLGVSLLPDPEACLHQLRSLHQQR